MDKKRHLQNTQVKLTVLFSLLVFCIASILQLSFFSYKYFLWVQRETEKINLLSEVIATKNIPLTQIHNLIKNEKRIWWPINLPNPTGAEIPNGKIMNFAILDSQNFVIVQSIRWNVDLEKVVKVINDRPLYTQQIDSMLIKYTPIERSIETYQLVLFKELNYTFQNFASDVFKFFILISLFSILFFVIGYYFVRITLRPVADNIDEMDNFVHNAGHELKTPLAVVSSNLQLMKQMKWEIHDQMLQENIRELKHMNKLIEALVTFTDVKSSGNTVINDMSSIIENIMNDFFSYAETKDVKILLKKAENFSVRWDKEYLYIFISNILKNAIKYSYESGEVHISFGQKKLIIQDFWIWIKKENMNKIFGRFYRQEEARDNEWFWIWLALVSKIAKIYKWKIKVQSEYKKWTKFIINF